MTPRLTVAQGALTTEGLLARLAPRAFVWPTPDYGQPATPPKEPPVIKPPVRRKPTKGAA